MKSLATLIKLQKTRVDEQRQTLARLLEALEAVEEDIAAHEIEQAREQLAVRTNPDSAMTYGAYVKKAVVRGKELEQKLFVAQKAVNLARERLAVLFEGQKRYEIAEAARIEDERREELRLETIEMDEIGSIGYVRRKKRTEK